MSVVTNGLLHFCLLFKLVMVDLRANAWDVRDEPAAQPQ